MSRTAPDITMRPLGRTGLEVSAVGFGGIKLPKVEPAEAVRAVRRALELGVNFIDTARVYGDSEAKIGRALKGRRDQAIIATKTTARDGASARADLETSLRELDVETIDLYQLHSVSDEQTWEQVMAPTGAVTALERARREGKIRHLGITQHRSLPTMRKAIESGRFATIMVAYSIIDQEGVGAEILPLAQQRDLGVIVMKGLSGGLIVSPPGGPHPDGPDRLVALALRHVISHPAVTTVIPGIRCAREIEEDAAVARDFRPLTDDERAELIAAVAGLRREFRYGQVCLQCGYCQPCPQGIAIPEIFRAVRMHQQYPDETRPLGAALYHSLEVKPDVCEHCGQCEERCPAGIPIREKIAEAAEVFGAS
jgi:predicted aldo/keto reductase-like oxidoreductase